MAFSEDLQYFIPVHGEYRQLMAHSRNSSKYWEYLLKDNIHMSSQW
ncbi:MAG: hypothetical protein ACLRTR_08950 [Clostridia bacterium]